MSNRSVSVEETAALATYAGLYLPADQLATLASRLRSIRDAAELIDALPLHEFEPASTFSLAGAADTSTPD